MCRKSQGYAPMNGTKYDSGKPRWDLLDLRVLESAVEVLTQGAKVHGPYNWRVVPGGRERYLAAMLRHIAKHQSGHIIDDDSGQPHMAHVICNAMFIMWLTDQEAKRDKAERRFGPTDRANDSRGAYNRGGEDEHRTLIQGVGERPALARIPVSEQTYEPVRNVPYDFRSETSHLSSSSMAKAPKSKL